MTLPHLLHQPWVYVAIPILGFLALLMIVAMLEKRLVRPYVALSRNGAPAGAAPGERDERFPHPSQASPYVARMSADLQSFGFDWGGFVASPKVPKIMILGAVWWSPRRDIVALAGSGTVLGMASYQTWLFTPLLDGRILVTTDKNDEGDHSGVYLIKRRLNVPMTALLEAHTARVQAAADQVALFDEPTAVAAVESIYLRRVERMLETGVARYADADQTTWSYTLRGAVRVGASFFGQLAGALTQFWRVNRPAIAATGLMPMGTWLLPPEPVTESPDAPFARTS